MREFCDAAFSTLDLEWTDYVGMDERYLRPAEVDTLQGDPAKGKMLLDWEPMTSFEALVEMMVEADLHLARQERALVDARLKRIEWQAGRPE